MIAGEIKEGLSSRGDMINQNDLLIAGVLLSNGCGRILTRNRKDFQKVPWLRVVGY